MTSNDIDVRVASFTRAIGDRIGSVDERAAAAHLRLTETDTG